MRLFLTVILFVTIMAQSAPAQDLTECNERQPLTTYVRVDGRPCVASTAEEFAILTDMVEAVNELRRKRDQGAIDSTEYESRVSAMLMEAKQKGVRVN